MNAGGRNLVWIRAGVRLPPALLITISMALAMQGCMTAMVVGRGNKERASEPVPVASIIFEHILPAESGTTAVLGQASRATVLVLFPAPILNSEVPPIYWPVSAVRHENLADPKFRDFLRKRLRACAAGSEQSLALDRRSVIANGVKVPVARATTMSPAKARTQSDAERIIVLWIDEDDARHLGERAGLPSVEGQLLSLYLSRSPRPKPLSRSSARLLALPGTLLIDALFLPISLTLFIILSQYHFF